MDDQQNNKQQEDVLEEKEEKQSTDTLQDDVSVYKEKIKELEKKLDQEIDAKLRALADCQNIKTRAEKEKQELQSFSQTIMLLKILDVYDDFVTVTHTDDPTIVNSTWFEGIKQLFTKFTEIIFSEGVEMIDIKAGDQFDANMEEAIGFVNVKEPENANTIAQVVSVGFRRISDNKTIKTAKVIVNKLDAQ